MTPTLLDLVLVVVGTVITVDPATPDGEAVAIQGGRIPGGGKLRRDPGDGRPVHPGGGVEGRVVLPGFIEGHGHFLGLGNAKR